MEMPDDAAVSSFVITTIEERIQYLTLNEGQHHDELSIKLLIDELEGLLDALGVA